MKELFKIYVDCFEQKEFTDAKKAIKFASDLTLDIIDQQERVDVTVDKFIIDNNNNIIGHDVIVRFSLNQ